jgi:hypothetical protein
MLYGWDWYELWFHFINIFTDPSVARKFQGRVSKDPNYWTKEIAMEVTKVEMHVV